VIRRVADVLAAMMLLAAAVPVLLVAAMVILIGSPGPVLFRQTRVGRQGANFRMFKLRTMHVNADDLLARHLSTRPEAHEEWLRYRRLGSDPRLIPGGRWIRRLSIDEIPQLLNVLGGDMTLIGPRPLEVDVAEQLRSTAFDERSAATPGLTGLWQISGRSQMTLEEMVRLDLEYVRNRSVMTDLRILARTPMAVISGRGAF
jgi:lipopolysaccharide/colanic/teichoic acid biosynthesis glycosyltransferase